jgi:hypothetical protein
MEFNSSATLFTDSLVSWISEDDPFYRHETKAIASMGIIPNKP